MSDDRRQPCAGIVVFFAISLVSTWLVAASLRVFELNVAPTPVGTRLLTTSLLYVVSLGFQPIFATWFVRRWIERNEHVDLGLRPASPGFNAVGLLAATGVAIAAALLMSAAIVLGLASPSSLNGTAEVPMRGGGSGLVFLLAVLAAWLLLWGQAFAEEIGWRGYMLPRLMARYGPVRGLLLHGVAWGVTYGPTLFFAIVQRGGVVDALVRTFGLVMTCALLGTLLGWLRLASRSLAPTVLANTCLTLVAGLPYVLHGVDAGVRSSIYGPIGWGVLGTLVVVVLSSRLRLSIRTPVGEAAPPVSPELLLRLWLAGPVRRPRGEWN